MEEVEAGQMWSYDEPQNDQVVLEVVDVNDTHVSCRMAKDRTPFSPAIDTFRRFATRIDPGTPGGTFTCTCRHPVSLHRTDTGPCAAHGCSCGKYERHSVPLKGS